MGFWSAYWSSLKPLEVEEPIDVYLQRPLGYVVARLSLPTPISPDWITGCSILAGFSSAYCLLASFRFHLQWGAFLLFFSAVLDCADGQLARMRGTSSPFGRMLDGVADLLCIGATAPATLFITWRRFASPWWEGVAFLALGAATMVTSSFHTTMYDHYKNVFLRMTGTFREGEDYETARARHEATRASRQSLVSRFAYPIYLFYLKSQRDYVLQFDPYTQARVTALPSFDPERAALYRKLAGGPMRLWRGWFGFGSLVFGLALCNALEVPEAYLAFRLVVLNALFYLYLRPRQREASREAFLRINTMQSSDGAKQPGI